MRELVVFALIFVAFVSSQTSAVYLDALAAKFTRNQTADEGFISLPRTRWEAVAQGWEPFGLTCRNGGRFAGYRYRLQNDTGLMPLFDIYGTIAGAQTFFPHDDVMVPGFNIGSLGSFQNETINGRDFARLTVYFVHPDKICSLHRTESDPIEQVGGTEVWFQNGPTPNTLVRGPREPSSAPQLGWTETECFPGMGLHYFFKLLEWYKTDCNEIPPWQLMYRNNVLTGFVLYTIGVTKSRYFENPSLPGIQAIVGEQMPDCAKVLISTAGITSIHFFFTKEPWTFVCPV